MTTVDPPVHAYLPRVREMVRRHLGAYPVTVYLFGSVARGGLHRTSDIDLAVAAARPLPLGLLAKLREAFEESTLPCHVDLVDLRDTDDAFRERVRTEGIPWIVSENA